MNNLIKTSRLATQRQIAEELDVPYEELDRVIELINPSEIGYFNSEPHWDLMIDEKKKKIEEYLNPNINN